MPFTLPIEAPPGRPRMSIGMLGTYPPRLCGLATFAAALETQFRLVGHHVAVIGIDLGRLGRAAAPHAHELCLGSPDSIHATAELLSSCDVAIIQHEYGIYGGPDGDEIIDVLRQTTAPTVVVLHTVPMAPSDHQRSVLETVCDLATRVVVMTETASSRLLAGYVVDADKVHLIPHGAWSPTDRDSDAWPAPAHLDLLTWGLIGPGKGIEHMIDAMALLGDLAPSVRYTIAGVTHPNVLAHEGDRYRESLIQRAFDNGVARSVLFDDTYRDVGGLQRLVAGSSVVVLPYDSHDQVTSGVLVDAIAAGRPVIATEFPHAVELLSDGAGILVPHHDPQALADAVRTVLHEPAVLPAMTARARQIAPTLAWSTVAAQYLALCATLEPTSIAGAAR